MSTINERLARVEANTENILNALEEIKKDRKDHLDRCHIEMTRLSKEVDGNTRFKNILIRLFWIFVGSSGGGVAVLIIYHGVKIVIEKGVVSCL